MSEADEPKLALYERLSPRLRGQFHRFSTAAKRLFQLYGTTVRAFFFPDSFQLYTGTLVRALFTLYYIPFLAIVFAVTHSALQRVVWVLIIPIAQEMERNPYNYSYWATFLYGISTIFVRIMPFAALGLSVLTVGYKVQHCVGEAMMDAFVTHEGEDYPLLHARLRFMREDRTREVLFLSVLALALATLVVLLHTNAFVAWTMSGERTALVLAAWTIIFVEACFVAYTALTGAPKEVMEDQWHSLVSPIRRALTAPSSTEVSALADTTTTAANDKASLGHEGAVRGLIPPPPSSAASSSGPSSPYSAKLGSATHRPRRRREPFWRPLLQRASTTATDATERPAGSQATSTEADKNASMGNSSMALLRGVVRPTVTSGEGSATSSIAAPPLSATATPLQSFSTRTAAGMADAPSFPTNDTYVRRWHSTSDVPLVEPLSWDTSRLDNRDGSPASTTTCTSSTTSTTHSSSDDEDDEESFGEEDTFLIYFQEDWWRENIHKMRYIAITMVTAMCFITGIQRGLVSGLTLGVLLVMCLNLPHMVGYATLAVCTSVLRTYQSFAWLYLHRDAFWPFVVLVSPYQVPLLYAIYFFRHHSLTVLLLLGGTALLLARGIDLVREFDVTEKGCVHWHNRRTGELLTPSLASVLETAYARVHHRPDLVSLDLVIDIQRMCIYDLAHRTEVPISRTHVYPYGAARRYLRQWDFYSFVIPRMVSLQSPGYFTGSKFRMMRVVLRVLMVLLALSVSVITMGILLQAAFPNLRPLPVRVQSAQDGHALIFDHVVVRMHLQAKRQGDARDAAARDALPPVLSAFPGTYITREEEKAGVNDTSQAASPIGEDGERKEKGEKEETNSSQVMLKLSNVTSGPGVDFYPQLCTRNYYGTSVWELALLALAPYLYNIDELTTMLHFMNTHLGSDWELRPRHGRSCRPGPDSSHQPTGWMGYFEVYSASRNTSVIAVRGTDMFSFTDFLIDMNLFFEPVLFQVLANTIPGARLLPKGLVVDAIHATSLPETLVRENEEPLPTWAALQQSHNHSLHRCQPNNYMRNFFADVENHLAYIGSRPGRPRHVILTGHSMGGAVASIVASKMGVQAVAFSAPGVVSARKKFGLDLMDLHQHVVSVASSNDLVPQIGTQGGEVQHLECLATRREFCHAMEFMVGTLWRSCSSVREHFPNMDDIV